MNYYLLFLYVAIIFQRLLELYIARSNARWIQEQGGYEVGSNHYKWIVLIHLLLFTGIAFEAFALSSEPPSFWALLFFVFVGLQMLRIWCICSLGRFWNTRIFILPHRKIHAGPYRYIKHPNYLVVQLETFVIPLLFGAYTTALVLPVINGAFLYLVRIPIEEKALQGRLQGT